MSKKTSVVKRRSRLSFEPLEPRRLLDVSGVWQELGFRSASGSGLTHDGQYAFAGDPAVAQTPEGLTVVAYEGPLGIQAQMFDGFAWVSLNDPVAQSIPNSASGIDPDVAVDHLGNVYVAWRQGSGPGSDVYMSRGTLDPNSGLWTWTGLAGSDTGFGVSNDGVTNGSPAIAVGLDVNPVIAYAAHDVAHGDMDVVAKKYVSALDQWVELTSGPDFTSGGGGVSNDQFASAGWSQNPQEVDIAIGGDNAPIVVWSSTVGSTSGAQIYARRWNEITSTWEKIGGQSASDPTEDPVGGVSDTVGISLNPKIAIRQDPNQPDQDIVMVAWRDLESLDYPEVCALYIKRLDDATPVTGSWVQVSSNSASGGGIVGRGNMRGLSLDIGVDGLPLIGITRYQTAQEELAVDTTPPWTDSNQVTSGGNPLDSNWYAWGLEAYSDGGETLWRWMGAAQDGQSPNYGVNQARYTQIVGLPDGSALLVFGEDLSSIVIPAEYQGGPWDPGHYPAGAVDPEIYAHRYDPNTEAWGNYGAGSGEAGGVDNDIRWNSEPVLATAADGSILVAYAERIGSEMFVRVRRYDDQLARWVAYGQGLEQGIPFDESEDLNHTYRWDEVAIASDPTFLVGAEGRPVVAYLDYVNTADTDAGIYDHGTITAWAYDQGAGVWERLDTGSTGEDQYAYVTEGTVWEGYLVDQIEVIAGDNNQAFLSWRNVDPRDGVDVFDYLVHVTDVQEGGRQPFDQEQGSSEIYVLQWVWDGASWVWTDLGDNTDPLARPNPFGGMPELNHLNFDPSLLVDPDGDVWVAFAAGRLDGEGKLLSDIAVYEFSASQQVWLNRSLWSPYAPNLSVLEPDDKPTQQYGTGTHAYAHPQLSLGLDQRPVIAWEDQEWSKLTLQDLGVLGPWNTRINTDPNSRPLWDNTPDPNIQPQWRYELPLATTHPEPQTDANGTFANAEVIDSESVYTRVSGEIRTIHVSWDSGLAKWVEIRDVDYYRVKGLPPDALLAIEVTDVAGLSDITLTAYDSSGAELGSLTANYPFEEGELLLTGSQIRAGSAGDIVVLIEAGDRQVGTYTINVSPDPEYLAPQTYVEQEHATETPNLHDTFFTSEQLTQGYVIIEGSLRSNFADPGNDPGTDVDFFRISGLYPGTMDEPNTYIVEVLDATGFIPLLGEFLFVGLQNMGSGEIEVTVQPAGTITFAISGVPDVEFNGTVHGSGDYRLRVRPATVPESFEETEPNDSTNTAQQIESPNLEVAGELTAGDRDFYLIHGLTPEAIYKVGSEFLILPYDPVTKAVYSVAPAAEIYLRANQNGDLLFAVLGGVGTYTLKVEPLEVLPGAFEYQEELFYDINGSFADRNIMLQPSGWAVINGSFDEEHGDYVDYYEVRLPYYDETGLPFYNFFTEVTEGGDQVAWVHVQITSQSGDLDADLITQWDGWVNWNIIDVYGWDYDIGQDVDIWSAEYGLDLKAEIDLDRNELVARFAVYSDNGKFGAYTVDVQPVVEALVVEDAFLRLDGASIRTAQFHEEWSGDGYARWWTETGEITPPEGKAYILPELVSGSGYQPFLTYTSVELDNAGIPMSQVTRWRIDLGSGDWTQDIDPLDPAGQRPQVWYGIDLGLRSYFNGDWGGQGDGFPSQRPYSDLVASYFNPRILYGARHLDFEFAWWRTQAGWGSPEEWWVIENDGDHYNYRLRGPSGWYEEAIWDDYRTPIPGHSEVDFSYGWQADGHVADTSYIHVLRYNGFEWEQINSKDPLGNVLESAQGVGVNGMIEVQGQDYAWAPGFGSSIGVRGVGGALYETQPVVAWNYLERNLIHVRQWMPQSDLPRLKVTETSGIANDGRIGFGRVITHSDDYETVVLKNIGNEALTISGLVVVGDGYYVTTEAGQLLEDADGDGDLDLVLPGGKIQPGSDVRIRVHYNPDEPGLDPGTLYIFTNDPLAAPLNQNWYTVVLAGSAFTGGDIEVTETVGIHNDLAVPFGLVAVGGQSQRTLTITNKGTSDLTVKLSLQGVGTGFVLPSEYDDPFVIAPGESEEVTITFNGVSANQEGTLGYLVIEHDDYGDESGYDPVADRQPYTVMLIGNMPSLMNPTVVGAGSLPTIAFDSLAYVVGQSGLDIYDIEQGGLPSGIESSGAGRPRSDGDFTVYAKGGAIWLYDRNTGASINLMGDADLSGLTSADNPNIEGNYLVFSANTGAGRDIFVVELNVDPGGSVSPSNPVAAAVHVPNVGAQERLDDHPDITGNDQDGFWVVWRQVSVDPVEGEGYSVFGKYASTLAGLATAPAIELSVGASSEGVRIPRVSGEYAVWVERYPGESRVVLYRRGHTGGVLFSQQNDISDEVAISGDLLVWSDNRNGDYDLFGYFLPTDDGGGELVNVRGRQFRLTFTQTDEITPDVSGSWVAWNGWATVGDGAVVPAIQFAGVSADAKAHVELEDGTDLTGGGVIDFGDLIVDVDGSYSRTIVLEISNTGTGILSITDVVAALGGNAEIEIVLPADRVIHQGPWTRQVELILTATGPGEIDGTVTILTNDAFNGEIVLDVDAWGLAPTIVLSEDSAGTTPVTGLDFGDVEQTAEVRSFYVVNDSTEAIPLVLFDPVLSDPTLSASLVLASSTGAYNVMGHYVLDPGEYALFNVVWSPVALGPLSATLELSSNDIDHSPATLTLTGQSVGYPTIVLLDDSVPPVPIGASMDFGDVMKGTSADMTLVIRNDGIVDLVITTLEIDNTTNFNFVPPVGGLPITVAPDESIQLTVRYTPDVAGPHTGAITINSNDPDALTVTVDLTGVGYVIPEITVVYDGSSLISDVALIEADETIAGSQWSSMLTIRNDDEGELIIDSWQITPLASTPAGVFDIAPLSDYTGPDGRIHLASGQEILVPVYFKPPVDADWQANGGRIAYAATLTINNNDDDRADDGDTEDPFVIDLAGQGVVPLLAISASSHAFGNVQVGEAGTWTFEIENEGQADLVLSSWASSIPGIFEVTSPDVSSGDIVLEPGESVEITVAFTPDGVGNRQGTISFTSNDPTLDDSVTTLSVSGRGVAGTVVASDTTLQFTDVMVHTTSTVPVTITNIGEGVLTLDSWESNNALFTLDPNTPPMILSPGESTTLNVIFAPIETGFFSGHITINSDDPVTPAYVINLTGSGTAGDIDVTEQSGSIANDDSLDLGDVPVGQVGSQTFTVHNLGQAPLTISHVELVYDGTTLDLGLYSLDPGIPVGGLAIQPGQSTQIRVDFAPTDPGVQGAELRLYSDDPDESPYTVELTGRGVVPDLVVLESSGQQANDDIVGFGPVKVGTTASIVVTLRNDGQIPLNLTGWSVGAYSQFALVPATPSVTTLAPGQSVQMTVQYSPTTLGDRTSTIQIMSNDHDQPIYTLAVNGTGVSPVIRVEENSGTPNDNQIAFGDVYVGETALRSITVYNDGQAPLILQAHESSNAYFTVQPANGAGAGDNITIQPGGSVTLDILFTPVWKSSEAGVITLVNDAVTNNRYAINVTGKGLYPPVPGDFDDSGQTDLADFEMFEEVFGLSQGDAGFDERFDLVPDGVIDFADLAVFARNYGQTGAGASKSGRSAKPRLAEAEIAAQPVYVSGGSAMPASTDEPVIEAAGQTEESDSRSDDDTAVRENLAAAFYMGALPTDLGVVAFDGASSASTSAEVQDASGVAEARASLGVIASAQADMSASDASSELIQGAAKTSSASFAMAAGAEASEGGALNLEDLGEIDAVVAPYASALLPS